MTNEEKLAEEYRKELKEGLLRNDDYERLEMFDENVEEAYLAGRKSNSEVIAELEKENAELKADNDARKFAMAMSEKVEKQLREENAKLKEKLKTAYRKGMRHMAKALKDYDRTDGAWTDYFEHTVDKVLQREQLDFEEYGTLAERLTKAKEMIKELLESCFGYASKSVNYEIKARAEQFLKEIE